MKRDRVAPTPRSIAATVLPGRATTPVDGGQSASLTLMQFAIEVVLRTLTILLLSMFLGALIHQFLKDRSRITLVVFAFAELLTMGLALLARVPRERDWSPFSLVVTPCATFYFLAFQIEPGIRLVPEWFAAGVQVVGMAIQIYAKWSLRRSFGLLPANRGVVIRGPYRYIRHPMYLGYFLTDIGFLLANFGIRNVFIVVVQWTLQVARILREESLLSRDEAYRGYRSRVRYRLIRGVF